MVMIVHFIVFDDILIVLTRANGDDFRLGALLCLSLLLTLIGIDYYHFDGRLVTFCCSLLIDLLSVIVVEILLIF